MIEMEEKKRKYLEEARRKLSIVATIVYRSASGVKPFRASKFLNILGKELHQLEYELRGFLDSDVENYGFEFKKMPSLQLLKAMQEEKDFD